MNAAPQDSVALAAGLYVVATPLGNLADITLRALDVLRRADLIAAEDTRHSATLLGHYGIRAPMLALHEHNETEAAARVVRAVAGGEAVALITDAGTPGVSDPGARAVAAARAAGCAVIPVPGPSAVTAALSVAGLAGPRFLFCGFLPVKAAARQREIEALRGLPWALVLYEAPHRIAETLADLAAGFDAARHIVIARELTKAFEQVVRLPLGEAPAWLAADPNRSRGEFVLVVDGAAQASDLGEATRVLRLLMEELPPSRAARVAAQISGVARGTLYDLALEIERRAAPL
jgi:16S rRNA (cytidine1402-2'-O)-methyltransferase